MKKQHLQSADAFSVPAHECDTVFDHSQNSLTQTISERVKLVISLANSIGIIYLDNKPAENVGVITTDNWAAALAQALRISIAIA